ncbi:hypothetical protein CDAR_121881 [Caerostris darwini]|uniref:Uncharacterized protein n=1 Tax=Caerostris darwini TaxID=1538125 RepID=A0AAV4R2B4_9ARAC|nr:hypothetical protein CDAR_121881 [Caerostris darwini]
MIYGDDSTVGGECSKLFNCASNYLSPTFANPSFFVEAVVTLRIGGLPRFANVSNCILIYLWGIYSLNEDRTTNQKNQQKCVRKSKKKKPKPKKDRSPDAIPSLRNKPVRLKDISSGWEHQHFLEEVLMT